jgi:hypothetical protein
MRSGGFFAGAVGGLALALLLVGVASYLPGPVASSQAPALATLSATTSAAAPSTTTQAANAIAAIAGEPASTTSVAAAPFAVSSATATKNATLGQSSLGALAATSGGASQRPDSFLAVLPAEGAGSLLATVSPLLVGLLVAALVFAAYSRRQDS